MRSQSSTYALCVVAMAISQGMIGVWVKWIAWPPLALVSARCWIAAAVLFGLGAWQTRGIEAPPESGARDKKFWIGVLGGGVLLAAHWGTLFVGYRVAPVAPVVVSTFTFPLMASLAEPFFWRARPSLGQVSAAALGVLGVALVQQGSAALPGRADGRIELGIVLGLVAAACFAARGIYNRKLMVHGSATGIMAIQVTVVAVLFAPFMLQLRDSDLSAEKIGMVLLLGVGFTALPHTLITWALRGLDFATTGVLGSIQVQSALVLAHVLLDEAMGARIILGGAVVLVAVVIQWVQLVRLARKRLG